MWRPTHGLSLLFFEEVYFGTRLGDIFTNRQFPCIYLEGSFLKSSLKGPKVTCSIFCMDVTLGLLALILKLSGLFLF